MSSDESEDDYNSLLAASEESALLSNDVIRQLKELTILVGEVPESHCIERSVARPPTNAERESLDLVGVETKFKRFSPDEDSIIQKNWEKFKTEYHFEDPMPFLQMTHDKQMHMKKREIKHFVQYLGQGLPHRTLYSIYGRFRTLYSSYIKGPYSKEEDVQIADHLLKGRDQTAYSTLSKILNRERVSIYHRYKRLRYNMSHRKGPIKWCTKYAEEILLCLLWVTQLESVEDLRKRRISLGEWRLVEEECGIRAESIRYFWNVKFYTQLFASQPVHLNDIRSRLVERLYRSRVRWWEDIKWSEIARDFGVSPMFLWSVFRKYVKLTFRNKSSSYLRNNLRRILKKLKKEHLPILRTEKNYYLQRLRLGEDGKLYCLNDQQHSES